METSGDFLFMGEYHYAIDEKGRLTIPSKVRFDLGEQFIITRGFDNCLFLYPMNEWNQILEKYKTLPNTQNVRNFMRFFLSGATEVSFDKQGRINIPMPLIKYSDLLKDCILIVVNERLEIWSKENWENFIEDNEENLSDIADKLFSTNLNI